MTPAGSPGGRRFLGSRIGLLLAAVAAALGGAGLAFSLVLGDVYTSITFGVILALGAVLLFMQRHAADPGRG
ncbi:hypothetical protein [Nesterenkonia marinintestina]|uniref:hypothetical protein n=1 Tax=Nesterenkonia marinintestina TaxID=2979865 RepID=UPI0021C20549|nr:hypothetical protein [Nesterenkonia sp. GX14115]